MSEMTLLITAMLVTPVALVLFFGLIFIGIYLLGLLDK